MNREIKRRDNYFVYIVRCSNGTYYTGYTNDLNERIRLHNSGHGAKYLRGKLPVKLVYAKAYKNYKNVLHAERNLKELTRKQKEELIRIWKGYKSCAIIRMPPQFCSLRSQN